MLTPRKKKLDTLRSADCFHSSVASRGQLIGAFFNWLQRKSAIQSTSSVRSLTGLLFLIFSSLAFACFIAFLLLIGIFDGDSIPASGKGGKGFPPVLPAEGSSFDYGLLKFTVPIVRAVIMLMI